MALETLEGLDFGEFVVIDHEANTISFNIQDGPIKEHGLNGCQVDMMIRVTRRIIEGLNEKFRCRENAVAITKLQEAEMWLKERKREREARGVEGYDKS
jgi:hypothetical protein